MASFRDNRARMRRDVHLEMAVPALYIVTPGATPLPVLVRVHTTQVVGGEDSNAAAFALRRDIAPRVIFLREQVAMPVRNAVISLGPGEAYQVQDAQPPQNITISASVTQMPIARTAGLPVPIASTIYDPAAIPAHGYLVAAATGHGIYRHTGATQTMTANVATTLINNRGTMDEQQKPADIATFYDGTKILGRLGDGLVGTIQFNFTPADEFASTVDIWLERSDGFRTFFASYQITKGAMMVNAVSHTFSAYNRELWTANGVTVKIESDGAGVASEVRYTIHRIHKGASS